MAGLAVHMAGSQKARYTVHAGCAEQNRMTNCPIARRNSRFAQQTISEYERRALLMKGALFLYLGGGFSERLVCIERAALHGAGDARLRAAARHVSLRTRGVHQRARKGGNVDHNRADSQRKGQLEGRGSVVLPSCG